MASYMTDSYMAGTTISRHVGELEPLTLQEICQLVTTTIGH